MYDPSNPYPAPIQGYSWAGQPPQTMNPFAAAGTSMIQDYAIMRQQEELRQYQQTIAQPAMMSPMQQSRVAYQQQYQFGVMGGQQQMYNDVQRNSAMMGTSFALSAGMVGATWPLFTWGDTVGKGLLARMAPGFAASRAGGVAGMIAGGAVGMGITAPFSMMASHGVERARFASDIQSDIEDYSGRWTGGLGFGRSATKAISFDMMRDMNAPGQFFRAEDQLKIHKMGLASGMVKGRDTSEYKRSFEALKNNAQDIIKLLNTTVEGGMSVMAELNKAGITSPGAMRQQVMQAKGIGAVSGLGTQNVMALGAAGASAALGTAWSPASMSNAYQANAALISNMAQRSPSMANAVIGVGGLPQAAAAMANAQSNLFMSGMGTQAMAAMMDPRTRGIDAKAFERLASGQMGVFELTGRAANFGSNTQNRVLFDKYRAQNLNKMSEEQKAVLTKGIYNQFASTRGGPSEGAAWVFAGQFTNNIQERMIMSEMLTSPINFASIRSGQRMTEYQMRASNIRGYNPVGDLVRSVGTSTKGMINDVADRLYGDAAGIVEGGARMINGIARGVGGFGLIDMHKRVPSEMASQRAHGYRSISAADLGFYETYRNIKKVDKVYKAAAGSDIETLSLTVNAKLKTMSTSQRQEIFDIVGQATTHGENLQDSADISRKLGIRDSKFMKLLSDVDNRKILLSAMNDQQREQNSKVEVAQKVRESWNLRKGEKGYDPRGASYVQSYNSVNAEYSNLRKFLPHEMALSKAMGGANYQAASTIRTLMDERFGSLKGGIALPSIDNSVYDAKQYQDAMANMSYYGSTIQGRKHSTLQGIGGAALFAGGVALMATGVGALPGAFMAAAGGAVALDSFRTSSVATQQLKGMGQDQVLAFMNTMLRGTKAGKEAAFASLSPEQAGNLSINDFYKMAKGQESQINSSIAYRGRMTEDMLRGNISLIAPNASPAVKAALERVGTNSYQSITMPDRKVLSVESQQKADLDKLIKSDWGKSVGMDRSMGVEKVREMVLNSAVGKGLDDIDQKMRDALIMEKNTILKEVNDSKNALSGATDEKGNFKDARMARFKNIQESLKNLEQQTAGAVTSQGQQTAAPNILNYWNCQWMIR